MKTAKRQISIALIIIMLWVSVLPVSATENEYLEAFVARFYEHILGREPDQEGLDAWVQNLADGTEKGVNVGYGFIQSQEFLNRNLNDEAYVRVLYRAFFDREADETGLEAWLSVLGDGLSRLHVYKGFAESVEFGEVCARYEIEQGTVVLTAPRDQNEGVAKFIVRCYRLCLGREADEVGLNDWCDAILSGSNSAKQAAYGFVFSEEFLNQNLEDEDYVKLLYRVFMNRDADADGLEAWKQVLANGESRFHVFNGFADSAEFAEVCAGYGIEPGPSLAIPEEDEEDKEDETPEVPAEGIGSWSDNVYVSLDAGFILKLPLKVWEIEKEPYLDTETGMVVEFMAVNTDNGKDGLIFITADISDFGYNEDLLILYVNELKKECAAAGMEVEDDIHQWILGNVEYKYFSAFEWETKQVHRYYCGMLDDGRLVMLVAISENESFPSEMKKYFTGVIG